MKEAPTDLLHDGSAESYKGGLHLLMFGLACTFAAYNAGALCVRPTRRLAVNTVVYAGLALLEVTQVRQHWRWPE